MNSFQHSAVTSGAASIATSKALHNAAESLLRGGSLPEVNNVVLSSFEMHRLREELFALRADYANRFARNLKGDSLDQAVDILRRASTFRSRTRFDDPLVRSQIRNRLDKLQMSGKTVVLALPLGGGKAPNSTKTGMNYLPDVSEWTSWSLLAALCDALATVLDRNIVVMTVPDAGLHTDDLGFPAVEYLAHIRQAAKDLQWLGIQNVVVPDTLQFLPLDWASEVARRTADAIEIFKSDSTARLTADAQSNALYYILNMRVAGWTLPQQTLVTAGIANERLLLPTEVKNDVELVRRTIAQRVGHYIGVNHSLRTKNIPQQMALKMFGVDEVLRLTVHAKPGEPRPNLAPDGHMARPALLPMHGVGLIDRTAPRWSFATEFELESCMDGNSRLVDSNGRFIAFEAAATPMPSEYTATTVAA